MTETRINWHNIRSINNSCNEGFEEFVCQLARKENIPNKRTFIRKGKPDAGVECFWTLEDDTEWAWQAKYFTSSLGASQWNQLDKSVETVIRKHINVKKYFISIPIDPADARIDDQTSLLKKWDDHVAKWKEWAEKENLEIEFIPWWASDLITRLQRPENEGLTYFWFNKEEFSDKWFKEYLAIATYNLGERYTPDLNFELDIAKMFDGLARDEKFANELKNRLSEFIIHLKKNKLNIKDEKIQDIRKNLYSNIEILVNQYFNFQIETMENINYEAFLKTIDDIRSIIFDLKHSIESLIMDRNANEEDRKKYDYNLALLRDTAYSLKIFTDFIESNIVKLTNKPFLLLDGKAGVGKSHLLADVANKRMNENKNTILLLGQQFKTNEDPWTQIFKGMKVKCNMNEFLGALESKAQIQGSRILIFIDAINEGNGKELWPDYILGFLRSFIPYKWLGIVLSIRTPYLKKIIPENSHIYDLIIPEKHEGFKNVEYDAVKLFFKNYNIELPPVPFLDPEFQNPLFLKLFCEGINKSKLTKIPDGFQGITKIINFFIKAINSTLSRKFDYIESINVVDKVLKELIAYKIQKDINYIPLEEAYSIIVNLQREYNINGNFIESLISEGIIFKTIFWKDDENDEDGIYIAYERFEDHLTASLLLENVDYNQLSSEFEKEGKLYKFIKNKDAINYYSGIIESLSIQLPERFGIELYEALPNFYDDYEIAEAFILSLLWRKHSKIDKKVENYIEKVVKKYQGTFELFWQTIISVSSLPTHYFNANKIHSILYDYKLPDRDCWWNELIGNNHRNNLSVKWIMDWSWSSEDKSHISDESVKLNSIMMAWFLTSTNRKLRDSATKSLICLLKNRIEVLVELLTKFEGINDPYIYERLFAVAYGCALRTENIEQLKELSEYIYKTIFDKDLVYPHVLLRDYSRGVIEYTLYLKIKLNIDINKIKPLYESSFPIIPSDEEIREYKLNPKSENYKDYFWSQNQILESMEVEYTRDKEMAHYGNFGRYIFQSNFETWKEQLNPVDLKNIAIKRIFDLGYDVEKHGEFDRKIQRFEHRYLFTDRIGKKYQWIAMHELLAQVSDKYQMEAPWSWEDKKMVNFQGPWEPFIRDIDPTVLKSENSSKTPIFEEVYDNWEGDVQSWLHGKYYPDPLKIINISLDDEEWINLEGNFDWNEPELLGNEMYSYPTKHLWCQIRSYLVKDDDFDSIIKWLNDKNFMGRWMPESHENTRVFNREYYWASPFEYFQKDYYEGKLVKRIIDRTTNENIGDVIPTAEKYWWESGDKSIEDSYRILKPCYEIYSDMNLKYNNAEGVLYSPEDSPICYDLSEFYAVGSNLIIKRNTFLDYLEESNYRIFWTVLGEKNIIGGQRDDYGKWPSISGVYYLDNNGNLIGTFNEF
jgi:thiol-disulfide isomerase/thioredoxin